MEEMMTPTLPSVSARMCRKTPEEPVIKKTISRDEEGPATECPTLHDLCLSRYVRAEIVAGFVNALFLLFIAFFIFSEAIEVRGELPW